MSNQGSSGKKKKEYPPNKRLIVRNLDFGTTDDSLENYFSKFGNVIDAEVLLDKGTGRSKGFGFVSFETLEEAQKAMEVDPHPIDGRDANVGYALDRERPREQIPGKKLYVGKLPMKITEEEMREYFEQFGTVDDCFMSVYKFSQPINGYPQHKGFGFVTYATEEEANKVVSIRNHRLKDVRVTVRKSRSDDKRSRSNDKKKRRSRPSDSGDDKKPVVVKRKQGQKKNNNKNKKDHKHSEKKGANKKEGNKKEEPKKSNKDAKGFKQQAKGRNNNKPKKENREKKDENKTAEQPPKASKAQDRAPKKKRVNVDRKPAKKSPPKKPIDITPPAENPWGSTSAPKVPAPTAASGFPSLKKKKSKKQRQESGKGKGEVDN